MNILVTGGAGYIGSHFINKLLANEPSVEMSVIDNFGQGRKNVIKDPRVVYYDVDLCDKSGVEKVFRVRSIDLVVHFAALASVPDSMARPREYYFNNLVGGLNLLDAMVAKGVKKMVFSSSASVYGEPVSEVIKEDHPKNPTNPYGQTKFIFEHMLQDYHRAYGINSVSFRYFCASGCDESGSVGEWHSPETHVIPSIIETLLGKREVFYVYGRDYPTPDGSGIRDYIHVNDLASAHLLAMKKLFDVHDLCEAYNLGINKGFSVLELIAAAEKIAGKKLNYQAKERRPGDPSRLIADADKARRELGWKPSYTSIESVIETAYRYFQKRP
jgi:UDP-glucose 4-epimerase